MSSERPRVNPRFAQVVDDRVYLNTLKAGEVTTNLGRAFELLALP